jgi:hypothetical protein
MTDPSYQEIPDEVYEQLIREREEFLKIYPTFIVEMYS